MLDFGIAKLAEADPPPGDSANISAAAPAQLKTQTPRSVGTTSSEPLITPVEGREFDHERQKPALDVENNGENLDIATVVFSDGREESRRNAAVGSRQKAER